MNITCLGAAREVTGSCYPQKAAAKKCQTTLFVQEITAVIEKFHGARPPAEFTSRR